MHATIDNQLTDSRFLSNSSKSTKYFAKQFTRPSSDPLKQVLPQRTPSPSESDHYSDANTNNGSMPARRPSWRIKSQQEYIQSLSASEIRKKGGLAKLEKQPANRYFKRKKLADIIMLHGKATTVEEKEHLTLFVHFLLGILDPDPWKRWTAFQASQHPFVTGTNSHRQVNGGSIHWVPPWDPSICRRKLLNVQKTREKQQSVRRSGCGYGRDNSRIDVEMRASGSDTTSTVLLGGSGYVSIIVFGSMYVLCIYTNTPVPSFQIYQYLQRSKSSEYFQYRQRPHVTTFISWYFRVGTSRTHVIHDWKSRVRARTSPSRCQWRNGTATWAAHNNGRLRSATQRYPSVTHDGIVGWLELRRRVSSIHDATCRTSKLFRNELRRWRWPRRS